MAKESREMIGPMEDIGCYLSDNEREHLVASLHDILSWVGVQPPDEFHIDTVLLKKEMERLDLKDDIPPDLHSDRGIIDLRNLIWRLVNEKELTEKEEIEIKALIDVLKTKELQDEETLKESKLTCKQARQLYEETESIIRALLDLKDILNEKKPHDFERGEVIRKKVEEVKRWNDYVKEIEK